MDYTVDAGLYALGRPDEAAPVLVTANYKMSFDRLRSALPGRSAWILVLDTDGINVWCAAGKGSFGTEELIQRIADSPLSRVVSHRRIILPQLGAPGVAAHLVRRRTGFRVIYGPVEAEDLAAFLDAGNKATPAMRRKSFPTRERMVLIPVELVQALKWTLILSAGFFLTSGLGGNGGYLSNALTSGGFAALALFGAMIAGAVLTPLLLPWLPGRAFALKGMVMGLIVACTVMVYGEIVLPRQGSAETAAWFLLIPALSAYLAMNFTGASTYTSLSGVRREMRYAVPLQIGAAAMGLVLWIAGRF